MKSFTIASKFTLLISTILISTWECKSEPVFACRDNPGDPLPHLPNAYSTDIRINYLNQLKSVQVRYVVNTAEKRMAVEFWHPNTRHIKYIQDGPQVLVILYRNDSAPICTVKNAFVTLNIFEMEDHEVGNYLMLKALMEGLLDEDNILKFKPSDATVENGVFVRKWEGCLKYPRINISLSFTEKNWGQTFSSSLLTDEKYLVQIEAQKDHDFLTAVFSNFNPAMPDDAEFQPPTNAFCEGYRSNRSPPSMPNYFSYDSEIIVYESNYGIAPVVSQRKVYYDFPAGISRIDFYDPLAEDQDLFSPVRAQGISIIQDFNSGIQYRINPVTGRCELDSFKTSIGPVDIVETKKLTMRQGDDFFSLNGGKLSYNGQFLTRGYMADVFTGRVKNPKGKGDLIYTWYFSTNRTQVVENEMVEKNVLLRMVIRPEAADGKEGEVDINFYKFVRREPSPLIYDLRSCYNDSLSNTFVLTFPAVDSLIGSEKLLRSYILQALKVTLEVSKQRIFVTDVTFSGNYMFAEFKLLASPDVYGASSKTKESTLEEAVAKLKKSVANNSFNVSVPTKGKNVILNAEPDGLNELAGDRRRNDGGSYKEGSVIALTIGMLFLGIVLGGVALNLVVSRKFGVSLCQKSDRNNPYSNSLGESSM